MKMNRLCASALSACLLLSCTANAYQVPIRSVSPSQISSVQTDRTVTIPRNLLDAMEHDLELKNFLRFISFRDIKKFLAKMEELYTSFDTSAQVLTTSHDLAYMDSACSGAENAGPIGIVPARLNGEAVTLVVLGGTMFVDGQAAGLKEDLLSALEQSNDYLKNVVRLFDTVDENGNPLIPADKPVVVSGISLGGMVAQQLLAQKDLMNRFDLRAIICFGSPMLAPCDRTKNTKVVRFCDTMDIVPYLGKSKLLDIIGQEIFDRVPSQVIQELDRKEMILKDGGYKSPISAHTLSYVDGACWDGYDILGVYGGSNQLVMDRDMQFFANPSLTK